MEKQIRIKIDLFPWQEDCLRQILANKGKIHIIKSKRQTGKSVLCQLLILKFALEMKNTVSAYILPSFKQCAKTWREITQMIDNKSFVKKVNNQLMIIEFTNGSIIQFFSGEQKLSAIQGFVVSGILIFDEGAFIQDDIYEQCFPWCNVFSPTQVIVSTPQYKAGYFYKFWLLGKDIDNQDVICFDFCDYDTSALLSPDKLEFYKKTLPANTFRAHYLGYFIENSGSVFGDFQKCIRQKNADVDIKGSVYFGIDWGSGSGNDYTAISVIDLSRQVLDIQYFNNLDPVQAIDRIVLLAVQYSPFKIKAEKNSIGDIYLSMLKQKLREANLDIPVVPFVTTNDSKYKIVSLLQVAIQNNDISLPEIDELNLELSSYEQTLSNTNKPVFNGKKGVHDDLVMSLMIALDMVTIKNKAVIL